MIHLRGTGPQKRLSAELPRLSPIMKYSPAGTLISFRLHSGPAHSDANGSSVRLPLRITRPLTTAIVSPGMPTTRLTNVVSAFSPVGCEHDCRDSAPPS